VDYGDEFCLARFVARCWDGIHFLGIPDSFWQTKFGGSRTGTDFFTSSDGMGHPQCRPLFKRRRDVPLNLAVQ